MNQRPILDMCCDSRMFWLDKQDSRAVFSDMRNESHTLRDGRRLPRTYRGRSAHVFKPRNGETIRLCGPDATPAQVLSAYEALINDHKDENLFEGLAERFFNSADFFELSPETSKDFQEYAKKILSVFAKRPPDTIKPGHVRKYMDKRGLKSRTQANREKAFMSRVFRWGCERGMAEGLNSVKRLPETVILHMKNIRHFIVSLHQL